MLRVLEYFEGVLIMTTNRVLTLDAAMISRIHYAIRLPNLEAEQERLIWDSYLRQLNPSNCRGLEEIGNWVGRRLKKGPSGLNGREIRNLFTTAQRLAAGDNEKICLDHIERVYETMGDFRNDMKELVVEARHDAVN